MRERHDPIDVSHTVTSGPTDEVAGTLQGGWGYLAEVEHRLGPYVARAEPRRRALTSLQGLLSTVERKHSWQLADIRGDATPYGFQHLLGRADGEADAVRDALRRYLTQHLEDPDAVLVLDETGVLKKGRHAVGGARQYRGTAGKVEHGQIGVCVAYASRLGHALLDRARSLPAAGTAEPTRCRQAGLPADRPFAAGVPATWVTGASVSGGDRRLRQWWEARPQASVLAVSGKE